MGIAGYCRSHHLMALEALVFPRAIPVGYLLLYVGTEESVPGPGW